jgi:phosphoglycolate phosphatase-like HAD superfamily hydrolase
MNKADLVRTILKKYNITNAAVVGDRLSDIKAAKDNGLVAIGCNFDFSQEEELAQADIVIDGLIELKTILPKLKDSQLASA